MSAAEQLIAENLDIWTSAVQVKSAAGRGKGNKLELYGIKKLRELILELAVRGLLVPQDPDDEPASELLKKIAAEKAQLVKDGKIKKQKALPAIKDDEKPFELPDSWEWVRLGDMGIGSTGKTPSTKEEKYFDGSIPFIGPGQVTPAGELTEPDKYLSEEGIDYSTEALAGDILMVCIGGSIGKSVICDKRIAFNQQINAIRPLIIKSKYLNSAVSTVSFYESVLEKSTGSATPIINRSKWEKLLVPVCPLEEQNRIVAKVDELMALCDQLEQHQETSITAHQTLVQTLLDALTTASERDGFTAAWARIADHFDTLLTTEWSIDQLKQTILQLAVMGKLVPQDPNDEPASELLKRIAAEKAQLVKDGKIKKQKVLLAIEEDEKPFELPEAWEWCRLPEIGELARGKSKHRPRNDPALYSGGNVPLVQTGDVSRADGVIETYTALYNETGLAQSRLWPKGTMCITIAANIADTAVLGFEACFPDSVVGFTPFDKNINVRYFDYFIRTAKNHLEEYAPSTAQKNINLEILAQLLVPLPPLRELNKIVVKVDEFMALCDTLKTRINTVQTTQFQLADAMAEKAIS